MSPPDTTTDEGLASSSGIEGAEPTMTDGSPSIIDSRRWYVVHAQPKNEMRAVPNLERQGYHTFCPCMRHTVRHARKSRLTLVPMFPGYVFVQMDVSVEQWHSINGTRGVIRLITNGDNPVPVPVGIVEDLQRRISPDGALDWASKLKIGDQVKISDGPFAAFVGTLEKLDASGRVRVLLDLLGRSVTVSLRAEAIASTG